MRIASQGAKPKADRASRPWPAPVARAIEEARHVRGPRTAWSFLKWLVGKARWWLRRGRRVRPDDRHVRRPQSTRTPDGSTPAGLGAEIAALGTRASRVFAASGQVHDALDEGHVDVVLADSRASAADADAPVVSLEDSPRLAVPAVDIAVHNPIGWVRNVENRIVCLGPPDLLPPGVNVHRQVAETDREALRRSHHVEDVRTFHANATERAGTVVRLAAAGVPVHLADRDTELEKLLGAELHELLAAPDIRTADADARELVSIRTRRVALRDHSLRSRARQVCAAALDDPPDPPTASILLATNRPALLSRAVANVARQNYPRLELVLALHGDDFDVADVKRATKALAMPLAVIRLDGRFSLGSVLNAAADAAGGMLLTKMDDDDLYGADHVWDLVLAREYSAAELVGKGAENVYLERLDKTIRRRRTRAESYTTGIAGAAMLFSKEAIHDAGGWRRLDHAEDRALVEDVLRMGGAVYRTHGAGLVVVRYRRTHTWGATDEELLAGAAETWPGWHPVVAGLEDPPPRPQTRVP